jgi:hypothetical protein
MKSSFIVNILFVVATVASCQAALAPLARKTAATTVLAESHKRNDAFSVVTRRKLLVSTAGSLAGMLLVAGKAQAISSTDALISDLETSLEKLKPIPSLLEKNEWDAVRTILKTPPVNQLWNLGDAKNPLQLIAKATDEFGLIEVKDELSLTLQMCDQLTYDNVFIYFQPGTQV